MTDIANIIAGLSEAQRQRLQAWPDSGSTFMGEPDAIACELCELGIGVIMPWKHGKQMGLTSAFGLKVHIFLIKGGE